MKQTSTKICYALAFLFFQFSTSLIAQTTTPGEVKISVTNSSITSICEGDTPNPFIEIVPATTTVTNTGFQYQWMQSPINTTPGVGSPGWTNIVGATSASYSPPSLTISTYYSRCVRPIVVGTPEPWVESNPIYVDVEAAPAATNFTVNGGTPGVPGMVYQNQPTVFNATLPSTGVTFEWDFDMDGDVDCIGQNCFNVYTTSGMTQTMLMTVSNTGANCMSSVTESFMVATVLPVELTSFKGKADEVNSNVSLTWTTDSETNSSHFVLEKSAEGSRFEPIGIVESFGNGNSNTPQTYSFNDNRPSNGVNYYRLKQIDFDDNFEYFQIISVQFNKNDTGTFVYPNPAKYRLTVETDLSVNDESIIEITDTYGKIIQQSIIYNNALNTYEIGVENLKGGVYFLSIISKNEKVFSQRVIIIN